MGEMTARVLRLPVGTRVIVTTHPLCDVAGDGEDGGGAAGRVAVEVWSRSLEYRHGEETVRVYEVRPARGSSGNVEIG